MSALGRMPPDAVALIERCGQLDAERLTGLDQRCSCLQLVERRMRLTAWRPLRRVRVVERANAIATRLSEILERMQLTG